MVFFAGENLFGTGIHGILCPNDVAERSIFDADTQFNQCQENNIRQERLATNHDPL